MSESRYLPYLRLVRAPAVFSALGDPLAGMLIANGGLPVGRALTMAVASGATYLGGMALNDYADREEDARERPQRPIPSGAVPAQQALALGGGLLCAGALLAARGGGGRSGAALAGAVVAYNFGLKHGAAGPAAMGACRALSLLSGAEAAGGRGVLRAAGAATILGSYVAGLTLLARGETGESGNPAVVQGVVLAAASAGAAAARGGSRAFVWTAALASLAGGAALRAAGSPGPRTVGPAVGAMIRALPALDAALAAPRAPLRAALMAAPLLALTRWGRRLIPIS